MLFTLYVPVLYNTAPSGARTQDLDEAIVSFWPIFKGKCVNTNDEKASWPDVPSSKALKFENELGGWMVLFYPKPQNGKLT